MKHNLILYTAILVLSGLLIYNINRLKSSQKVMATQSLELKSESAKLQYSQAFLQMYESEIFYYFNYAGFRFDENFKVYDCNREKEVLIKDIGSQFFFAFDNSSCETCVNSEIFRLKSEYPGLSKKVAILTTKREKREIDMMRSKMKIPFDIYTFDPESSLGFNLMQTEQPFYFILDKEQYLRHLFIVNTDHPKLNKEYLDYVAAANQKPSEISMN